MSAFDAGPHLTDNQFMEYVLGEVPGRDGQAHLAVCEACREELSVFLTSMDDFSVAALDWSKAQPVASPRIKQAANWRMPMLVPLQWAAATVLVLAVSVPLAIREGHGGRAAGNAAVDVTADDSPAQIAQDNRMMQSVDAALAETASSPFDEYGISNGAQAGIKSPLQASPLHTRTR